VEIRKRKVGRRGHAAMVMKDKVKGGPFLNAMVGEGAGRGRGHGDGPLQGMPT